MIICMQCGFQNEGKEQKECSNCGALLPRMDTSAMVKVETVSGKVKQFSDAIEKVRSEEWGPEEFYEFLHGVYTDLQEKRAAVESFITENEYEEFASEEVGQGIEGMNQFEMGMEEMSLYVEDGDITHLDIGLEKIARGNEMINDAMRINRAERKRLEDEWGWM